MRPLKVLFDKLLILNIGLERIVNLKAELDNLKVKHKESIEIHSVLSQENKSTPISNSNS